MKSSARIHMLMSLSPLLGFLLFVNLSAAQTESPALYPAYPSETPAKLEPATDSFDYIRRDVMIPMREGSEGRADPAYPNALRRQCAHHPR